jgi:hypothetical protein
MCPGCVCGGGAPKGVVGCNNGDGGGGEAVKPLSSDEFRERCGRIPLAIRSSTLPPRIDPLDREDAERSLLAPLDVISTFAFAADPPPSGELNPPADGCPAAGATPPLATTPPPLLI